MIKHYNGTAYFKNLNDCLNASIYTYLNTSGSQSSNLYLNVVYFLTPELIKHPWQVKTVVFSSIVVKYVLIYSIANKTFSCKLNKNIVIVKNCNSN
jgi:hypothetical protein